MENQRKRQLVNQVGRVYNSIITSVDQKSKVDDVSPIVKELSEKLAFGIIIHSGRGCPASYIGTHKQCTSLKDAFQGQVGALSNNWYWVGIASSDDIRKTVKNKQKNQVINVLASDVADATLNIGLVASLDIRCADDYGKQTAYVGNYKVCTLLRRKYGGKIGRIYNSWHWIGEASLDEIELVYKDYQSKSKRFKRKKIVLMF
ncbi:MAG: hypothetical protein E7004_00990 [Alphaproteobacteria bacterium]|nr:hypothetical protein [Alphaproteobacteria bacterium]